MFSKSTILLLLLCPLAVFAGKGDQEFRIHLTKAFKVNPGSKVEVNNKYGKIVIKIWDKPECKADIEIVGYGKNDEQAKKMAEMVEIKESAPGGQVRLETKYNPAGGSWLWGGGRRDSKEYVNVNYVISVPPSLGAMVLRNNFGDILAHELPFRVSDIAINYGFLDIGSAGHLLKVNMNYTDKARIGNAADLQVNANYSNLRCENVDNLQINSNNCNYVIGNIEELRLNCNYDDYKITTINTINLNGNYTNVKAEKLKERGVFSTTYSGVKVGKVLPSFKGLTISGKYSDFQFGIDRNTAFRVSASLRYGNLRTNDFEWKNVKKEQKNQNLSFSAITTNATDASALIKIDGAYCDVKLGGD
ncbi:hypothetical protein [Chitinophaga cymbidii]|uniref:Adhesin domain-containing protein n=1 Tax=Chitinophaga cymbidii TaxID=1096750 RepID=A0A512RM88_9BACT|nr:hypothetical protein [Chitinophaga cymbidii]GEP96821.1 hypothetical protein CCY01nite_30810 [Chitinophaga cymbidii]